MQFLADVYMKCSECHGRRYRREILNVKYRGRNIADVLEMTVREAFTFFRGHPKVQARLKRLIDVGLDYLRLGQPANTLSGGEAQRLKLAGVHVGLARARSLFLLDEPTTGLHFQDIVQLLDCFDALLAVGHSLIVVEHNLQLMKAADYIIDLGPGAADRGGRVVVQGTPEMVARSTESLTGRFLREALQGVPLSQCLRNQPDMSSQIPQTPPAKATAAKVRRASGPSALFRPGDRNRLPGLCGLEHAGPIPLRSIPRRSSTVPNRPMPRPSARAIRLAAGQGLPTNRPKPGLPNPVFGLRPLPTFIATNSAFRHPPLR